MAERWIPLGDRAIRFARPAGVSARALVEAVRAWPGVVDVVIAREDVAAYFDRAPLVEGARLAALATLPAGEVSPREVTIRVVYDGDDLDEVARAAGMARDEVIAVHARGVYVVDTIGFAPGFAYLVGLDPRLHLPRRATPRPRVPAGSLALAGGYTTVYPFASPGGWHLIGRAVDAPMFDAAGPRLALGDRVRFEAAR